MAKLEKEIKQEICKFVIISIENELLSFRKAVIKAKKHFKEHSFGQTTVYQWFTELDIYEHYARACEYRQEYLFEEILDLSDGNVNDLDDPIKVSRNKLQIDTRKWVLSKMAPKKYGDKVDVTSDGEKIEGGVTIFQLPDNGRD